MKLSIVEPIGISQAKVDELAKQFLPSDVEVVYYNTPAADSAEKIQRAKGAEAVIIANKPFKSDVLANCPDLKFLSVAFTGVDHVDMDYCRGHEITVSNCSGYADNAVSELVIGMCISLFRKLSQAEEAARRSRSAEGLRGLELCGKKFGIIGAGKIGMMTAALAKSFGCEVYCYRRHAPSDSPYTFTSMEYILQHCDIISLHMPLNDSTRKMIDAEKIALMKPNAILINTARGGVVDTKALAAALNSGKIAGAAIDVFDTEPPLPEDNPLLHAKNTLVTPHIGFDTQEAMEKRALIAFENVAKWLAKTPQNVMN